MLSILYILNCYLFVSVIIGYYIMLSIFYYIIFSACLCCCCVCYCMFCCFFILLFYRLWAWSDLCGCSSKSSITMSVLFYLLLPCSITSSKSCSFGILLSSLFISFYNLIQHTLTSCILLSPALFYHPIISFYHPRFSLAAPIWY